MKRDSTHDFTSRVLDQAPTDWIGNSILLSSLFEKMIFTTCLITVISHLSILFYSLSSFHSLKLYSSLFISIILYNIWYLSCLPWRTTFSSLFFCFYSLPYNLDRLNNSIHMKNSRNSSIARTKVQKDKNTSRHLMKISKILPNISRSTPQL